MDIVYNIEDLEAFINGLKYSFDQLSDVDPNESRGFQTQLAKAISTLRSRKMAIIEQNPQFKGNLSKEGLKKLILEQLEQMKTFLEHCKTNNKKRLELISKIDKLTNQLEKF